MTDISDQAVISAYATTTLDPGPQEPNLQTRMVDAASLGSAAPVQIRGRLHRSSPAALRVLIVAASYALPYRVMRCARQVNAETYVLGNLGAQVLAVSRYCTNFRLSHTIIAGHYDEDLAFEINCLARELDITMILPGDAPSTRALIACRHLLEFPCFPLPGLAEFDRLNDKWGFAQLCDTLGIHQPATRLFADATLLAAEIASGGLAYPAVAKARSLSASQGLVVLNGADAASKAQAINYRPVIVQEFIPGRDIGASIYCRRGEIAAFVAHEYRRGTYATFRGDAVLEDLARIAAHVGAEGVYNFDMIAADDGKIYYLECNPRFFYKINLSMLAGINFVALGLENDAGPVPLRLPDGTSVRRPEAVLTAPRDWFRLTRRDWAAACYTCSDPVPYLLDLLGWPT
jgi:glutathione synthase/RimK-type ligase-like ATP-grasp enzyme